MLERDLQVEAVEKTVLVTDVVDSTKLVKAHGDAATKRINLDLDKFVDIARVNGGIPARDRGDGYMFVFDDPLRAMRAAIAMQHRVSQINANVREGEIRIKHRMGLHLGEVATVAKLPDSHVHEDETQVKFTGETVIMAARFESYCPPGEVCFSQQVYRAVRHQLKEQVIDMEAMLKNIPNAERCWCTKLDPFGADPRNRSIEETLRKRKEEALSKQRVEAEVRSKLLRTALKAALAIASVACIAAVCLYVAPILSKGSAPSWLSSAPNQKVNDPKAVAESDIKQSNPTKVNIKPLAVESENAELAPAPTPSRLDYAQLDEACRVAVASLEFNEVASYVSSSEYAKTAKGRKLQKEARELVGLKEWLGSCFAKCNGNGLAVKSPTLPFTAIIGGNSTSLLVTEPSPEGEEIETREIPIAELTVEQTAELIRLMRRAYPHPKANRWQILYQRWTSL